VIKIVRDELIELLGKPSDELAVKGRPAVVMLCGLQGSGKTTTAGKLARRLQSKRGKRPVLVAGDLQRAAAVEQLVQVGAQVEVPVIVPRLGESVVALGRRALEEARNGGRDTVVFDTAGRLHVDDVLMAELRDLVAATTPEELLFVCDAMTGQDAVKSAAHFASALPLTGAILTKMDGDARGGAALSIRSVAAVPIRYLGTGERLDELELFAPDRLASRILGMGDVLSLIEKAEQAIDRDEAERLAGRIVRKEFSLEDLRDQLRQLRRMGPLGQLLDLMPKVGPFRGLSAPGAGEVDETRLRAIEALINSMTPQERRKPGILGASRKRRIAKGSGRSVQELNQLLKQYKQMQKMMKQMKGSFLRGAMGS
jgi:signal recognition particle subunit SRP54